VAKEQVGALVVSVALRKQGAQGVADRPWRAMFDAGFI
jgi:hypothetical protein